MLYISMQWHWPHLKDESRSSSYSFLLRHAVQMKAPKEKKPLVKANCAVKPLKCEERKSGESC
jgi:hypothetical protein